MQTQIAHLGSWGYRGVRQQKIPTLGSVVLSYPGSWQGAAGCWPLLHGVQLPLLVGQRPQSLSWFCFFRLVGNPTAPPGKGKRCTHQHA